MANDVFRGACKWYLGIEAIHNDHAGCPCPKCGRPMDAWGDHAVSCSQNGLTERHTQIRDKILDFARRGGFAATKEGALPDGDRPADVLIPHWDGQGSAAVDVTCTHPLKVSDNNTTPEMATNALQAAQDTKIKKYRLRCEAVRWNFLPAVCHPFGGWHGTGKTIMRKLAQRVAKEEQTRGEPTFNTTTAEMSYLMASITGQQLSIMADAGYHASNIPKRSRLATTGPQQDGAGGAEPKRSREV
jgi:hypothetical protein